MRLGYLYRRHLPIRGTGFDSREFSRHECAANALANGNTMKKDVSFFESTER